MVNFVKFILIPKLGSFVAGFFKRFLGSEGTAIMTTPEFLLPLFMLVLILTIIYRIYFQKKKKKSFLLLFIIYILVFFLCCLFRFFILEKIVAFLGVTTALSTLILNVSCSRLNSNVHSGREFGEISLPPAPSPRLVLLLLRIMPQAQKIQKKNYFPPLSQFSSPSTSTSTSENQSIDSSPNTK